MVHTSHVLGRRQIDTYQYTANSNNYQDGGSLPSAVFSYDMSPMQVLVQTERKSLASFLTQLCAIIGGVFTVTGLVDGAPEVDIVRSSPLPPPDLGTPRKEGRIDVHGALG